MVNRLIKPGSEFYVHQHWFDQTVMDFLLDCDFQIAEKNRLYRCLDRILPYKDELCRHLKQRWETMFNLEYDILLYDLTSTYFEGLCQNNAKAKFGHSKDRRCDSHPRWQNTEDATLHRTGNGPQIDIRKTKPDPTPAIPTQNLQ